MRLRPTWTTASQAAGTAGRRYPCVLCDGFLTVTDDEAIATARRFATAEGLFVGFSAGAKVCAALPLVRRAAPGQIVATTCTDTGLKYLSTDLFPRDGV